MEVAKVDKAQVDDVASQTSEVAVETQQANDKPQCSTTKTELWAFYIYYIVSSPMRRFFFAGPTCRFLG